MEKNNSRKYISLFLSIPSACIPALVILNSSPTNGVFGGIPTQRTFSKYSPISEITFRFIFFVVPFISLLSKLIFDETSAEIPNLPVYSTRVF